MIIKKEVKVEIRVDKDCARYCDECCKFVYFDEYNPKRYCILYDDFMKTKQKNNYWDEYLIRHDKCIDDFGLGDIS